LRRLELWELAAVTGHYLGPTHEEAKIDAMYEHEDELKAAMIARAKKRGDYHPQQVTVR